MPIATPEVYAEMLDAAEGRSLRLPGHQRDLVADPARRPRGFADAGCDGIIQISTGGAEYLCGPSVKNMVTGAVALAAFAAEVAKNYPVNIALHTDHCPKDKLDGYVRPLLDISAERVARGRDPLFQSHMWDGSAVPLDDNLAIGEELLAKAAAAKIILEVEITASGGEEDGVANEINDELYTTVDDAIRPPRPWAWARRAATCWPPPSATCTASTSRATSSCAPSSSRTSRPVSPRSSARPSSRSTSSSTAAPARRPRRSPPRWRTASSR